MTGDTKYNFIHFGSPVGSKWERPTIEEIEAEAADRKKAEEDAAYAAKVNA